MDHGIKEKHLVMLQNKDPAPDMEIFLNKPQYEGIVKYLTGNTIDGNDLARACLEE